MSKKANLAIFVPHEGCPNKCTFCNQNRISGTQKIPTPDEVREICEQYLPRNAGNTEIAFFGGSFTDINRKLMLSLLDAAFPFVELGRAAGIRISTRPDAIDSGILKILSTRGVTAIELGAQSMDDSVLAANRRGHTAAQVREASAQINSAGFSLGLQMMTGMYGELDPEKNAESTAKEIIMLAPDTVRIYPAIVVENTELCDLFCSGQYKPLELERAVDISAGLISLFEGAGINVIRVGLHADGSISGGVIAGPYHPAFGEMCRSRIMRETLLGFIAREGKPKKLTAKVNPKDISRAVGYKKENIEYFKNAGTELNIVGNADVSKGDVRA